MSEHYWLSDEGVSYGRNHDNLKTGEIVRLCIGEENSWSSLESLLEDFLSPDWGKMNGRFVYKIKYLEPQPNQNVYVGKYEILESFVANDTRSGSINFIKNT